MTLHLGAAWAALVASPLFGIALTLGAYEVGRFAFRRGRGHPLLNPVLVAIVIVAGVLLLTGVAYEQYWRGASSIALLLGPATVALAVPLFRQFDRVREAAWPILTSVVLGALTGVVSGVGITTVLGGSDELARSMAPKSATTPVAIALAEQIGGAPALTAVLTIFTGVFGAVVGPAVLTAVRVRDARVRGLALGASAHGIGTSSAFGESQLAGSFAGLAMALTAFATALVLPLLAPVLAMLLRG